MANINLVALQAFVRPFVADRPAVMFRSFTPPFLTVSDDIVTFCAFCSVTCSFLRDHYVTVAHR